MALWNRRERGEDGFDWLGQPEGVDGRSKFVGVARMMAVVMNLHCEGIDRRLKRIEGVGQGGQLDRSGAGAGGLGIETEAAESSERETSEREGTECLTA